MEKRNSREQRLIYEKPDFVLVKVVLDRGYADTGFTDETFINEEDL